MLFGFIESNHGYLYWVIDCMQLEISHIYRMKASDPQVLRFNKILESMSPEERSALMEKENEKTKRDFEDLKSGLAEGKCSMCGKSIDHFAKTKPCFHWFLSPTKIKKKFFPALFAVKSYHEIEAYLRWVANTEIIGLNINDLVAEKTSSKIIEQTIRYKNIEWSFSCTENDRSGHKNTNSGKNPHYHFQMKVGDNVIIRFSDLHAPFHDYDFYCFAIKDGLFPKLGYQHVHAASVQTLIDTLEPEVLLDHLSSAGDDESKAMFHTDTLIEASGEGGLPMNEILALQKEAKRTGKTLASLLQKSKLKNVSATTIITPGEAIPKLAKRKQRN